MKLPKGYLPREGDKVSLVATVRFNVEPGDDYVHVRTETKYGGKDFSLDLESVEIAEFAWRVGDRAVFDVGNGKVFEIAGISPDGTYAWLVNPGASPITGLISALLPAVSAPNPPLAPLELTPDDRDPIIEGGAE